MRAIAYSIDLAAAEINTILESDEDYREPISEGKMEPSERKVDMPEADTVGDHRTRDRAINEDLTTRRDTDIPDDDEAFCDQADGFRTF
jgi:hypothetical protein